MSSESEQPREHRVEPQATLVRRPQPNGVEFQESALDQGPEARRVERLLGVAAGLAPEGGAADALVEPQAHHDHLGQARFG